MNLRHAAALALVGWYLTGVLQPVFAQPARPSPAPQVLAKPAYDPPCRVRMCTSDFDCSSQCSCTGHTGSPRDWPGVCKDTKSGDVGSCCEGYMRKSPNTPASR